MVPPRGQRVAAAVAPSGEGAYVEAVRELIEQLAPAPAQRPLAPVVPLRRVR